MIESPFLFLPNPKVLPHVNHQSSFHLYSGANRVSVQYGSYVWSQLLITFREGELQPGADRNCSKVARAFRWIAIDREA